MKEDRKMEEMTIIPAEAEHAELISVVQLPIIQEQLHTIKAQIEARAAAALAAPCTEETVKSVKELRADLRRDFAELERRRKAVQAAVLKPYDEFMAVYRECVTDVFTPCDQELKRKIDSVEEELKARKAERVKAYFLEYCQSVGIDFLRFEDVGLNITKTVSEKRLKESAKACVDRVAQDCAVIGQQEHAAEIMAEYRVNGFDCVGAMNTVASRLRRERECRMRQEEQAEQEQQEQERQAKMLQEELVSFAPPQVCETPIDEVQETVENDPYKTLAFTVRGRLSDLRKLKQFLVSGPYEIV